MGAQRALHAGAGEGGCPRRGGRNDVVGVVRLRLLLLPGSRRIDPQPRGGGDLLEKSAAGPHLHRLRDEVSLRALRRGRARLSALREQAAPRQAKRVSNQAGSCPAAAAPRGCRGTPRRGSARQTPPSVRLAPSGTPGARRPPARTGHPARQGQTEGFTRVETDRRRQTNTRVCFKSSAPPRRQGATRGSRSSLPRGRTGRSPGRPPRRLPRASRAQLLRSFGRWRRLGAARCGWGSRAEQLRRRGWRARRPPPRLPWPR